MSGAVGRPLAICRTLPSTRVRCYSSRNCAVPFVDRVLDRSWLLQYPNTQLTSIALPAASHGRVPTFQIIRDDLLHPIAGNKLRKFDALFPHLRSDGVTDVLTCGGLQSAHTAAIAVLAAEHGMRAHLLVRGEHPKVPTGFHLVTRMYGDISYVNRTEYANREAMFSNHTAALPSRLPAGAKVHVVPEGGADAWSLLGLIRLVRFLADSTPLCGQPCSIVVDSGTGTSAIGIALGAALLHQPWTVTGVMLAGEREYYEEQARTLLSAFVKQHDAPLPAVTNLPLEWVERLRPRRFGQVLPGEVAECQHIARTYGILLDPIYSLAAWNAAAAKAVQLPDVSVVMLHAGGSLALHGLAQRFPDVF